MKVKIDGMEGYYPCFKHSRKNFSIIKLFSGIIAFDNGSAYGIWPLDGGDRGRRHPHVLYRTKWSQSATCGSQIGGVKQFQKVCLKFSGTFVFLKLQDEINSHDFIFRF